MTYQGWQFDVECRESLAGQHGEADLRFYAGSHLTDQGR